MSKKYLIVSTFIVFAIIVLGWKNFRMQKNQLEVQALPTEVVVNLGKEGFNPNKITIKKGTAVRWNNLSADNQSSVNSDDYPTNKLYPELNLGKFGKHQSLIHIFEKSGKYSYHDQFHPQFKGEIIVE